MCAYIQLKVGNFTTAVCNIHPQLYKYYKNRLRLATLTVKRIHQHFYDPPYRVLTATQRFITAVCAVSMTVASGAGRNAFLTIATDITTAYSGNTKTFDSVVLQFISENDACVIAMVLPYSLVVASQN